MILERKENCTWRFPRIPRGCRCRDRRLNRRGQASYLRRMSTGLAPHLWRSVLSYVRLPLIACLRAGAAAVAVPVDFNREIRPIFSEHCYACHGPDENKRKAGLRLDREEEAFRELKSGARALVAGDASRSAMASRIA